MYDEGINIIPVQLLPFSLDGGRKMNDKIGCIHEKPLQVVSKDENLELETLLHDKKRLLNHMINL